MNQVQQQGNSLTNSFQLQQQIIHSNDNEAVFNTPITQSQIYPLKKLLCITLYNSPQRMLIFTFILTVSLEVVMLKFVFMGIHFYIGLALCAYIIYLLLYLGFSDPGTASSQYEKLKYHLSNEVCSQKCKHAVTLTQEFNRICYKCHAYVSKATRHCNTCNVCVAEYDHHCVFIGKCIGKNNLTQFNQFLCFIFSTLIYGLVSALISIKQTGGIATLQTK